MTSEWRNPVYPEKGPCRIRKKKNALAQIGWTIHGWAPGSKCIVVSSSTRAHMELDSSLVEVRTDE